MGHWGAAMAGRYIITSDNSHDHNLLLNESWVTSMRFDELDVCKNDGSLPPPRPLQERTPSNKSGLLQIHIF